MANKNYTKKQTNEVEFHNHWGNSADIESIDVDRYFSAETSLDFRLAKKLLGSLEKKKVLDLGCGLGEASVYFALQGAKVVALDISPGMLDCVRKLAERYQVGKFINAVEAPVEKTPLPDESFDLVFGGNVLHHVNLTKASREIRRVLKKGGKAVFIEPLGYNPFIQVYRKMAGDIRTQMERPFFFKDIHKLARGFRNVNHYEQQLFTTLIFVWFFLGECLNPSKVRYWKRIIDESERYARSFKILATIDKFVLKLPYIKRMCWSTIIELDK